MSGAATIQAGQRAKRRFTPGEMAALDMYPWAVSLLQSIAEDAGWTFSDHRPGDEGYQLRSYQALLDLEIPEHDEATLFTQLRDLRRLRDQLKQDGTHPTLTARLVGARWRIEVRVVSWYEAPATLAVVR